MTKSVKKQPLGNLELPTNTCKRVAWLLLHPAANSKLCYENNPRIGYCKTQFNVFWCKDVFWALSVVGIVFYVKKKYAVESRLNFRNKRLSQERSQKLPENNFITWETWKNLETWGRLHCMSIYWFLYVRDKSFQWVNQWPNLKSLH